MTFVATKRLLEIPAAATGSVILLGMCFRYYYYYNAYWFDDGEGGRLVHSAASIMPASLLRPLEKMATIFNNRGHDRCPLRKSN